MTKREVTCPQCERADITRCYVDELGDHVVCTHDWHLLGASWNTVGAAQGREPSAMRELVAAARDLYLQMTDEPTETPLGLDPMLERLSEALKPFDSIEV